MKRENINSLLEHFIDITGVPVSKLVSGNKGELLFDGGYPASIPFLKEIAELCPIELLADKRAAILPGDKAACYGCIKMNEKEYLIVGPVFEFPLDNHSARELLEALNVPQFDFQKMIAYHNSVPKLSPHRFAQILLYINELCCDDTTLTVLDLLPASYNNQTETSRQNQSDSEQSAEERKFLHRKSQAYDAEVYTYLYSGQYQSLKNFLDKTAFGGDTEIYSTEVLQNYKYLVVSSIAVASRTASQGGVSYQTAMQIADDFIKMVDKARTLKELYEIHRKMLLSFTELVAECKLGKPASSIYYVVQNYIAEHLSEKITTSAIADALKINRTHLSKQFKDDTGMNLSDYINLQRIQEAKRLLIMSNLSLIEISSRLCFSSQSYFTEVFKDIVGCTPKEYRDSRLLGSDIIKP